MDKGGWKYLKKRLLKYKFCAAIINPKKVICICKKVVKLNRKWNENYLNRHVKGNGCKRKVGQQTILNFFNNIKDISSEEEYDNNICDYMDDDNIISVDSNNSDNDNLNNILSSDDEDQLNVNKNKRICCLELRSQKIQYYIKRTPVQVGGA